MSYTEVSHEKSRKTKKNSTFYQNKSAKKEVGHM